MERSLIIGILVSLILVSSLGVFFYFSNTPSLAQVSFWQKEDLGGIKKKIEDLGNEISNLKKEISLIETSDLKEKLSLLEKESEESKENFEKRLNSLEKELQEMKEKEKEIKKEREIKKENLCQRKENDLPKKEMIFNEVCWMGIEDLPSEEWIELKNISEKEIDLTGWQILNKNQKIKIVFEEGTKILPNGILVLKRGDDFSGAIKNSDEALFLFDKDCNLEDEVLAEPNWPAGDNFSKRTMERKSDFSWQTSLDPGGTPGKENSSGFAETEKEEKGEPKTSLSFPSEIQVNKEFDVSLSISNLEKENYDLKISLLKISEESEQKRTISEISLNGEEWQDSYKYLKNVFSGDSFSGNFKLRVSKENQDFRGEAEIFARIRQSENKKIVSEFKGKIKILEPETVPEIPTQTQLPEIPTRVVKILINEVQIAGDKASYDFIELYNPTDEPIDLSGYQLKKRNKTGNESSLGTFPSGSEIKSHGFFLWACSADGYEQIINADISFKSYYLTEDNSIAIFDKNKNLVDALAWGNGQNPFFEGEPFPKNPEKNQSLERINFQDTDNNSRDFRIQPNPTPQNSK
jgi:hypothetical protein